MAGNQYAALIEGYCLEPSHTDDFEDVDVTDVVVCFVLLFIILSVF